ncbi:M20/M25/M40 family metallo-hydrolase [Novosphingobium sp.]|uniref:M20/M25/M40 family metallo-hydrolase n=1 Tax=Novosphingobium sp. TaxID=1874826 RepID=UPI0025DE03CC|nr:M20/M25/M40 family metallo-hydrolase [Novosphingobium sp.]MCC6926920.1 M20/M25/M40 family metallo-hydrolase [Novosphingobium sp.]
MSRCVLLLLAATTAFGPLHAASRQEKAAAELKTQLMAHIVELASDAYGGREPGTDGEVKTLRYLSKQLVDMGLVSGTNDPGHAWFAPVTILAREPDVSRAVFSRKGKRVFVRQDQVLVLTSGKRALVENAPLVFVGTGKVIPARADLAGRVALLLDGGQDNSERQNALLQAGASGVLTVLDGERTLEQVGAHRKRQGYALAGAELGGDLDAFISAEALGGALVGTKVSLASLKSSAAAPDFVPGPIDLAVSLEATTRETRIHTHNVIGKLPGKRPELGAVLLLAHWDHFGECAEPPAEHLICNGAIDNASGMAVLIEATRRLARQPQLDRDVYVLFTTGEELGLLGAQAFAENPPVPLGQFVAAFNIDSVALGPSGQPFAVVGKGMTGLDAQIAAVAKQQKKKLVGDDKANAWVRRQDGWALLKHDVPAVMVSSSWSDIATVERFMDTDYHRPTDVVKPAIELGGAADDVEFLVALTRWFSDVKKVPKRP